MALPTPAANAQGMQAMQFQALQYSLREAISTSVKTALMSAPQGILTRSPILRALGGGAFSEMLEFKKREVREKQGRDPNTGRKLTKQELDEINARRASYGTMGRIEDTVQAIYELLLKGKGGLGVARGAGVDNNAVPVTIEPPKDGEGAYDLANEEAAIEKEREDDEDQMESEERQQNFFTKLFSPKKENKSGILGILSALIGKLTGMLGSVLGFLKGPFLKLLSFAGLDKLFVKLLPSLFKGIIPLLGGFLAKITPILAVAAGPLIALALAGVAGLAVKKFIDKETAVKEKAAEVAGKRGIGLKYKVEESPGKFTLKSAEELGTTDTAISEGANPETGEFTTAGGVTIRRGEAVPFVRDEKGNLTNVLSDIATEKDKQTVAELAPAQMPKWADQLKREGQTLEEKPMGENAAWLDSDLSALNSKMGQYDKLLALTAPEMDQPGVGQRLAKDWNEVQKDAVAFMKKAENTKDAKTIAYAAQALDGLSNLYGPFEDMFRYDPNAEDKRFRYTFAAGQASYKEGLIGPSTLRLPMHRNSEARNRAYGYDKDEKSIGQDRVVNRATYGKILNPTAVSDTPPPPPKETKMSIPMNPSSVTPPPSSGVPQAAAENVEMKQQSAMQVNAPTQNIVQQNNSSTGFAMPVKATRNGEDYGDTFAGRGMLAY